MLVDYYVPPKGDVGTPCSTMIKRYAQAIPDGGSPYPTSIETYAQGTINTGCLGPMSPGR